MAGRPEFASFRRTRIRKKIGEAMPDNAEKRKSGVLDGVSNPRNAMRWLRRQTIEKDIMTPFRVLLVALSLAMSSAEAQPRAIELFLTSGYARYAQDNTYEGVGVVYGGTFSFPIDSRLAIEADLHTNRTTFRSPNFRASPEYWPDLRRRVNFYSASTVYRLGSERVYGFFGAGPAVYTDGEEQARIVVHIRGGAVFRVAQHIVLRAEFLASSFERGAAVKGAKLGLGYRF
jgi:hypothetical protein